MPNGQRSLDPLTDISLVKRKTMSFGSGIPHGLRVEVYWNHRKKMFSVRTLENFSLHFTKGKVIRHLYTVRLSDVSFVVQQAGRQKELEEGRRIVHALCRGKIEYPILENKNKNIPIIGEEVIYDPSVHYSFVTQKTKEPIYEAKGIFLDTMIGGGVGAYPRITLYKL